jgi:hypothetical protein
LCCLANALQVPRPGAALCDLGDGAAVVDGELQVFGLGLLCDLLLLLLREPPFLVVEVSVEVGVEMGIRQGFEVLHQ